MTGTTIGRRVREKRSVRGLTREQLSAETGISYRALQRIEAGHGYPRVEHVMKIADALHVSVDWLLGRYDDESEAMRSSA